MSRSIFFYMLHMYAGILRFHSGISSSPVVPCVWSFSLSLSNTHASSHQCLLSENEYCFCLCEHLTFDYDSANKAVFRLTISHSLRRGRAVGMVSFCARGRAAAPGVQMCTAAVCVRVCVCGCAIVSVQGWPSARLCILRCS